MTTPHSPAAVFSWRFLLPVLGASTLNPINTSLIATALVPIAAAMQVTVADTAVLISALYLASAIAQPTGGKLAEVFGPRRVLLVGMITAMVGGLVGGFSATLTGLVAARVLIGIGSAAVYPSAMALIRQRASSLGLGAPPGGALGALVIAGSATAALGLPIGGVLVDAWGWQTTFLINVPVAAASIIMTWAWIPPDDHLPAVGLRTLIARTDPLGIIGFGAAITALLVFFLALPQTNWIALGLAIGFGVALIAWELQTERPFIDVRLLATNGALTRTHLRYALGALCVYTILYGLTQWIEAGRDMSARSAGLLLLPMSAIAAVLARPVSRRNLIRSPLLIAAGSCLAASAGVLLLTGDTPIGWIVAITLGFGITLGAMVSANQTALYRQAPADQIGTASGLFKTFGSIGSIASSAVIAIGFHTGVTDAHLHDIAITMIVASIIGVLLVICDRTIITRPRIP